MNICPNCKYGCYDEEKSCPICGYEFDWGEPSKDNTYIG